MSVGHKGSHCWKERNTGEPHTKGCGYNCAARTRKDLRERGNPCQFLTVCCCCLRPVDCPPVLDTLPSSNPGGVHRILSLRFDCGHGLGHDVPAFPLSRSRAVLFHGHRGAEQHPSRSTPVGHLFDKCSPRIVHRRGSIRTLSQPLVRLLVATSHCPAYLCRTQTPSPPLT